MVTRGWTVQVADVAGVVMDTVATAASDANLAAVKAIDSRQWPRPVGFASAAPAGLTGGAVPRGRLFKVELGRVSPFQRFEARPATTIQAAPIAPSAPAPAPPAPRPTPVKGPAGARPRGRQLVTTARRAIVPKTAHRER